MASSQATKRFKSMQNSVLKDMGGGRYTTESPDGYKFHLIDQDREGGN